MADIELVIKIDDDLYKSIIGHRYKNTHQKKCDYEDLINAIEDGTPLPKGHGRLGDLDALREEVSSWGMNDYEPSDFTDAIDDAPTVEAIPKAEYEARLKADLKAILVELQLEIEELDLKDSVPDYQKGADETREYIADLLQQKIDAFDN